MSDGSLANMCVTLTSHNYKLDGTISIRSSTEFLRNVDTSIQCKTNNESDAHLMDYQRAQDNQTEKGQTQQIQE